MLRIALPVGIHRRILPAVQAAVLSDGADLDADPAWRDVPLGKLGAVGGAGRLVREPFGVVLPVNSPCWAHIDAAHAAGAEVVLQQGVGWKAGGSEDRAEADPWAVLGGEDHVADAKGP